MSEPTQNAENGHPCCVHTVAPDPAPEVPVLPGNNRAWCWVGCGWWREVPMRGLDKMLVEREAHVRAEHPYDPVLGRRTPPGKPDGADR